MSRFFIFKYFMFLFFIFKYWQSTGTQWMLSKYLWKGRKQYFEILQTKQVTEINRQSSIYSDSSCLSKIKIKSKLVRERGNVGILVTICGILNGFNIVIFFF